MVITSNIFLFLVIDMSMKIIDESYFCLHALEFFFNLTESNKNFSL